LDITRAFIVFIKDLVSQLYLRLPNHLIMLSLFDSSTARVSMWSFHLYLLDMVRPRILRELAWLRGYACDVIVKFHLCFRQICRYIWWTLMHYEQYKQVAQRGPFINLGKKYEFARKIQKTNRDRTQMKIKEASKNEANELKY